MLEQFDYERFRGEIKDSWKKVNQQGKFFFFCSSTHFHEEKSLSREEVFYSTVLMYCT